jgi:hypothetical protein
MLLEVLLARPKCSGVEVKEVVEVAAEVQRGQKLFNNR